MGEPRGRLRPDLTLLDWRRPEPFGTAKLELETDLEFRWAPAPGQLLLQESGAPATLKEREAAAAGRSGEKRSGLLWFTTLVLYAAFVGLVRAQAVPSQAGPGGSH